MRCPSQSSVRCNSVWADSFCAAIIATATVYGLEAAAQLSSLKQDLQALL